jgi:hypothetical protein
MRLAIYLLVLFAVTAGAQDFPRTEFHTLYLDAQVDGGLTRQDPSLEGRFKSRRQHRGFQVAHVTNFSRISGLKLEVSWVRDAHTVGTSSGEFAYRQSPLWMMAGTQIKRNRSTFPLQPYLHVMGGAVRYGMHTDAEERVACAQALGVPSCPARFTDRRWTRAQVYGGGIDIRVSEKLDLRLVQVEYVPLVRFGKTLHSMRFGAGFSFR